MARLFILVEGETEETFVNEVLAPHLYTLGFQAVGARIMGNARLRAERGGVRGWPEVKENIVRFLVSDPSVFLTIMVDYYAMPSDPKKGGWPGRRQASGLNYAQRADCVEKAIGTYKPKSERNGTRDVSSRLSSCMNSRGCFSATASNSPRASAIPSWHQPSKRFATTSSRRENQRLSCDPPFRAHSKTGPGYRKPLYGNLAALEIGLQAMRDECPHFRAWLAKLEQLA